MKYRDAGLKPATGRSGSAQLTVRALVARDGTTELVATTGQLDSSTPAPGSFSKIQVKMYDLNGDQMTTVNSTNPGSGGTATFTYNGLPRGTRFEVQGSIQGVDPNRTAVITVNETSKLRPDLLVRLSAPGRAHVSTPVNISAHVGELNGDVGARANCVLYADGAEIDRANGIWVDAYSAASCLFTATFESTGLKQLEVRLENIVPGDDDPANNRSSGVIEIVEQNAVNHFQYSASAQETNYSSRSRSDHRWLNGYDGSNGEAWWEDSSSSFSQYTNLYGTMEQVISQPITRVELSQATGGVELHSAIYENLAASYATGDGFCVDTWDGESGIRFYLCSQNFWYGGSATTFQYDRYVGQVSYHSQHYSRTWDAYTGEEYYYSYNYSYEYSNGPPTVPFGDDFTFEVKITDGTTLYQTNPTFLLNNTLSDSRNDPYTCTTYHDPYWNGGFDEYCWGYESEDYWKYGFAAGTPD